MSYGQTPYQLGYLSKGNATGWSFWDTDGGMQQKNLILVSIMENTTPVSGLSPPAWMQDSSVKYSGDHSWKAGDGIYSWHYLDNYSSPGTPLDDIVLSASQKPPGFLTKIFNWLKQLITGVNPAAALPITNLTYWTQYNMTDNHGYVKVSVDRGATWDTLEEYSGNSSGWVEKTVNLTEYKGQQILVAFHFSSNNNNNDKGWWIDDIKVISDGVVIFSDDAETPPPVLTVNVSYPNYDHSSNNFSGKNTTIDLVEDYLHQIYYGVFVYPGDAYTGIYQIDFSTTINSENLLTSTSFSTTLWGCQARGCHDSWSPQSNPTVRNPTVMIHPDNITTDLGGNCLTICHSTYASQFLRATPVHLHDIKYGHEGGFSYGESGWATIYNSTYTNVQTYHKTSVKRPLSQTPFNVASHVTDAECTDCHTNFIHDGTGTDEHLIAAPDSLSGTNISGIGIHAINVTCEDCHGDLAYPSIPAQYSLSSIIGSYNPEFMSYEAVTDTYVINVTGPGTLNVTVTGDDDEYKIFLSLVGPMDDVSGLQDLNTHDRWDGTYCVPSVNGTATFAKGSKIYYPSGDKFYGVTFDSSPRSGIWIARVFPRSPGTFNYTITSSHPIRQKPVIHIPWNCSECHNPDASGSLAGARTYKSMPSWDNQGLSYTHADYNGDGKDDVTCRLCHNSFHDISIRNCTFCHIQRPGGHTMPDYYNMGYADCMSCHADPHFEPEAAAGGNCTDCHLEGGTNVTAGLPVISKNGFFNSFHKNITGDFNAANYSDISRVCWGCHNDYGRQLVDPTHYKIKPDCTDCHDSVSPQNAGYITPPQVTEHQPNGTDITTNATIASCIICHNRSLASGMPPATYIKNPTPMNFISHYGRKRSDMIDGSVTNCSYCHCNETNMFADTFENANNTNITHGGGYSVKCTDCHGSGRIHDAALSAPMMTPGDNSFCMNTACHGNDRKSWFVDDSAFSTKIHGGINCTDCHAPLPVDVSGRVGAGGTYNRAFTVDAGVKRLNVTLNWISGSLNLTLDANGTEINSTVAATDPNVDYTENGTFIRYSITNPTIGSWVAGITDVSTHTSFDLIIEFIRKHPLTGECFANPCTSCHVTDISYNAPPIAEHVTRGTATSADVWTNADCCACHDNDIVFPSSLGGGGVDTSNRDAMTAHYGASVVLDTAECIDCHENEDIGEEWGGAPDPRNATRYEYVEDDDDIEETIMTGEVRKLKNEYAIVVGQVSPTGNSAWIYLMHKDKLVKRELVSVGGVFEYEIEKDWVKPESGVGLYGTGNETYKHRKSQESSYTTIVDLEVADIFTSGLIGAVTFKGLALKSRMHTETENTDCYACHISGYRYGMEDGDDYIILRNTGADGDLDDSDDITIGRLAINFTEYEHTTLRARSEYDLGYGYLLRIPEIDLKGRKARVELLKGESILQSEVVEEGGLFTYNTTLTDKEGHTIADVTVFQVRIGGVFRR